VRYFLIALFPIKCRQFNSAEKTNQEKLLAEALAKDAKIVTLVA
jgi:hypothetical protein